MLDFISQKWDRSYCKNLQYSICNFQKYCKSAIFNSAIFKSIAIAIAIVKTYWILQFLQYSLLHCKSDLTPPLYHLMGTMTSQVYLDFETLGIGIWMLKFLNLKANNFDTSAWNFCNLIKTFKVLLSSFYPTLMARNSPSSEEYLQDHVTYFFWTSSSLNIVLSYWFQLISNFPMRTINIMKLCCFMFFLVFRKAQESPGEPGRARESPGEPGRARESPGEPGRARESPGETWRAQLTQIEL